jgi:hypothetical protein
MLRVPLFPSFATGTSCASTWKHETQTSRDRDQNIQVTLSRLAPTKQNGSPARMMFVSGRDLRHQGSQATTGLITVIVCLHVSVRGRAAYASKHPTTTNVRARRGIRTELTEEKRRIESDTPEHRMFRCCYCPFGFCFFPRRTRLMSGANSPIQLAAMPNATCVMAPR